MADKITPEEIKQANIRLGNKLLTFDVMLDALKSIEPYLIPGMNWTDETGELLKKMVHKAIKAAEGV